MPALSLREQIFRLVNSQHVFTDLIIHQDEPVRMNTPRGVEAVDPTDIVVRPQLEEFFRELDPRWSLNIQKRALDRGVSVHQARLRCNALSFDGGERLGLVIRRFPLQLGSMEDLGLGAGARLLASAARGLLLVTGQTGAGKTTSIATMLEHINARVKGHILTVEDPVEIRLLPRLCVVTQREVGKDVETFALGARDALRQKPTVFMVGEIRDRDTADVVLNAAESGHLVIASMHAATPEGALMKLLSWFPDEHIGRARSLARVLQGVISQALIPSADGTRWHLAHEVLYAFNHKEMAAAIEGQRWADLRDLMRRCGGPGAPQHCHTMNDSLIRLVEDDSITEGEARYVSFDRSDLARRYGPLRAA